MPDPGTSAQSDRHCWRLPGTVDPERQGSRESIDARPEGAGEPGPRAGPSSGRAAWECPTIRVARFRARSGARSFLPGRQACAPPSRPTHPAYWLFRTTKCNGRYGHRPRNGRSASAATGRGRMASQARRQVPRQTPHRPAKLPPDPMIEVCHRERKAKLRAQRMQHAKQAHAVTPTRNGHDPRSAQARIAPPLHPPAHLPQPCGRPRCARILIACHGLIYYNMT